MELHTDTPICDFCSTPRPARFFACEDFVVPDAQYGSRAEWAACPKCADLIDAGKWNELLTHAVDQLAPRYSFMPRRMLTDSVKRSHDLFRAHRKGMKP